ncbi:type II secretion system protein GspM [Stenotrophomonas humi]|nr:type II secretion system protein GspM [Stenotrophomonas humi]
MSGPGAGSQRERQYGAGRVNQVMQHLRANAARLVAGGQLAAQMNATDLSAMLAASAGKHGLSIALLQPRPDQRIAVTLSGHPSAVVAWLEELQNAGVAMTELTLAQGEDGSWKGDMLLSGPGS